jgi:hypothetical protein
VDVCPIASFCLVFLDYSHVDLCIGNCLEKLGWCACDFVLVIRNKTEERNEKKKRD